MPSMGLMTDARVFRTMWGRSLRWLTALSAGALIALTVVAYVTTSHLGPAVTLIIGAAALIALATILLRQIRGFAVTAEAIYILHLGWRLRLPLDGLVAVAVDPEAMRDAHMTFGGGRFADFFRTFRNRRLGDFTAFVTDRDRTVVLRFKDRTVVVSPADPEGFAEAMRRRG